MEWLRTKGLGLGLKRSASFEQLERTLAAGDILLLYTDGLTEAVNPVGAEFGDQRLAAGLVRHRALTATHLRDALVCDVDAFAAEAPTPQLAESIWAILEASADLAAPERAVALREEALGVAVGLMRAGAERAAPLAASSAASYARSVLAAPTPARLAKAAGLIEKCRAGVVSDYPVMRGNIWVTPPSEQEAADLLSRLPSR